MGRRALGRSKEWRKWAECTVITEGVERCRTDVWCFAASIATLNLCRGLSPRSTQRYFASGRRALLSASRSRTRRMGRERDRPDLTWRQTRQSDHRWLGLPCGSVWRRRGMIGLISGESPQGEESFLGRIERRDLARPDGSRLRPPVEPIRLPQLLGPLHTTRRDVRLLRRLPRVLPERPPLVPLLLRDPDVLLLLPPRGPLPLRPGLHFLLPTLLPSLRVRGEFVPLGPGDLDDLSALLHLAQDLLLEVRDAPAALAALDLASKEPLATEDAREGGGGDPELTRFDESTTAGEKVPWGRARREGGGVGFVEDVVQDSGCLGACGEEARGER